MNTCHLSSSEQELAERLPGNPLGFITLLDRVHGRPIMACMGITSNDALSAGELQEAYQETLIAVWRKCCDPQFDPHRPLRMIYAIAKIKALDACRRKFHRPLRRPFNLSDLPPLTLSHISNGATQVDQQLADAEEYRHLRIALSQIATGLPPKQKVALLAFLECYRDVRKRDLYKPLAARLSNMIGYEITPLAAKSALRSALRTSRKKLAKRHIGNAFPTTV